MKTCIFAVLALASASAAADELAGTLNVDPVELVRGTEVQGKEDISATYYRFRYLFANEANKAEFEKHPKKYEIQLGGACARMGPLSGVGRPDLYTVYQGKIYIFASEACRNTFLRAPELVLERPEAVPTGSDKAKREGRELLGKAVAAMGGAGRIDAVEVYQERRERESDSEGQAYNVVDTLTIKFPDKVRTDHIWGDDRYTMVVTGDDAWKEEPDQTFSLHPQQREAAEAQYLGRNLLVILKSRNDPKLVAVHTGRQEFDYKGEPVPLELVSVHYHGATSILGLDPESGRILLRVYHGRGPNGLLGFVERIFTDFESVDGILLPKNATVRFNGEEQKGRKDSKVSYGVDVPLVPTFFRRPES